MGLKSCISFELIKSLTACGDPFQQSVRIVKEQIADEYCIIPI